MSSVGGHYHKNKDGNSYDPWSEVNVARGNKQARIDFGIQWPGVLGRVMVVHDVTGGRVACGEIMLATDAAPTPAPTAPTPTAPTPIAPTPTVRTPTAPTPTAPTPTPPTPTAVPTPAPTPAPTTQTSLRLESS